jgi:hypothetical protein
MPAPGVHPVQTDISVTAMRGRLYLPGATEFEGWRRG